MSNTESVKTETHKTEILNIQLVYQRINEHEYEIYCKHDDLYYFVQIVGDILYYKEDNGVGEIWTDIDHTLEAITVLEVDEDAKVIDMLLKGDYDTQMVDNLIDYIIEDKRKEI